MDASSSDANSVQLTSLLYSSTPYLLAYTLPLLIFSVVLTFAGTFLTIYRSRSSPERRGNDASRTDSIPGMFEAAQTNKTDRKARNCTWKLEGGMGGIVAGYIFGLHAVTFLSLLSMNTTSSRPLTPSTFLVAWVFTVVPTTIIAARWRVAALGCIGMASGATLSLALSIILHPSLPTRRIIAAVFTPLFAFLAFLPYLISVRTLFSRSRRHTRPNLLVTHPPVLRNILRFCTASAGAFSLTQAIALLGKFALSWANAWERFWVADGSAEAAEQWGGTRERGFSALFCVLCVLGATSDWALGRWVGQCPEEVWDDYLTSFPTSLPNAHNRAGTFRSSPSRWARFLAVFGISRAKSESSRTKEMLFPSDAELAYSLPGDPKSIDEHREHKGIDAQYDVMPVLNKEDEGTYDCEDRSESQQVAGFFDLARKRRQRTLLSKEARNKRRGRGFRRVDEQHDDLGQTAKGQNRGKRVVQFQPLSAHSSSDTDSQDELETPSENPWRKNSLYSADMQRNFVIGAAQSSTTSLSGTTIHPTPSEEDMSHRDWATQVTDAGADLDIDKEKARLAWLRTGFGRPIARVAGRRTSSPDAHYPEYSDVEDLGEADVTSALEHSPRVRSPVSLGQQHEYETELQPWKPKFMRRLGELPRTPPLQTPKGVVPMTPSLLLALQRVAVAQQEAFGPIAPTDATRGSPNLSGELKVESSSSPQRPTLPSVASEMSHTVPGLPLTQNGGAKALKYNMLPSVAEESRESAVATGAPPGPPDMRGGMENTWDTFWRDVDVKAAEAQVPPGGLALGVATTSL